MFDALRLPGDPDAQVGFRLGDLQVEPLTGVISGAGGREQVDPKVMAVLVALARRPHELVTREELLESIWPGGTVYDDALTQCVYQLRRQLVAAGGSDRYRRLVSTLPKRGYLLNEQVHVLSPGSESSVGPGSPAASRWPVTGTLIIVFLAASAWWLLSTLDRNQVSGAVGVTQPTAGANTLAVLPFINRTGDSRMDYLGEGISDDLRDHLALTPQLRLVARRSSVLARDLPQDARGIGQKLGVGRLIEGRLELEQGRVVISVELVDTATGFQLWSRRYERPGAELLLLEQSLALDLVRELSPGSPITPAVPSPTAQQLAAHDLLLLARQYEQRVTDEQRVDEAKLQRVIELYQEVLSIDPLSSAAHARLGRMLLYQGSVTEAEPHILRALELAPARGDTFTTLGLYYWAVREAGSGAAYQRAIALNPNDADALSYLASWSWLQANPNAAVMYYRAALKIDPLNLVRYADLGYKLAFQGSREEAQKVSDRLVELFPTVPGYLAAARIAETLGDLDEAVSWTMKAREIGPESPDVAGQLAELLARLGEYEVAARYEPDPGPGQWFWQRRYPELLELAEEALFDQPGDMDLVFLLAFAYSAAGRDSDALRLLESAGLPENARAESRRAGDLHAMMTYLGALNRVGRPADAKAAASWNLEFNQRMSSGGEGDGWLPRLSSACSLVVLRRPDDALSELEALATLKAAPWLPWLKDLACFDGIRSEDRYNRVVAAVESRLGAVRARLPATLARHGVRLP